MIIFQAQFISVMSMQWFEVKKLVFEKIEKTNTMSFHCWYTVTSFSTKYDIGQQKYTKTTQAHKTVKQNENKKLFKAISTFYEHILVHL